MLPPRYWRDDDQKNAALLADVAAEVERDVVPHIPDFQKIEVHPVKGIRHLGKYIAGSHRQPVVAVTVRGCQAASQEYALPLRQVLLTTILHELGHAVQEARKMPLNEDQAEAVAFTYWKTGRLPEWVTNRQTA